MRTVATKVESSLHEQLLQACNSKGCTPSEYMRSLIKEDLEGEKTPAKMGEATSQFIPHNSNPGIKLVRSIEENGRTYYIDTEGLKWGMKKDRSLISVARLARRLPSE